MNNRKNCRIIFNYIFTVYKQIFMFDRAEETEISAIIYFLVIDRIIDYDGPVFRCVHDMLFNAHFVLDSYTSFK